MMRINSISMDQLAFGSSGTIKELREQVRMNRASVGGTVIIWTRFVASRKRKIGWVQTKMTSGKYFGFLETKMIECAEKFCGDDFILQPLLFFLYRKTIQSEWLAGIPTLNHTENLPRILAYNVYALRKQ